MSRLFIYSALIIFSTVVVSCGPSPGFITYHLDEYRQQDGMSATVMGDKLAVIWQGDDNQELRLLFGVDEGVPVIKELAVRTGAESWEVLGRNLLPEYRVVSGVRRVTQQQTVPLEDLGIPLTEEKLNEIKWDAFWDAPLYTDKEPPRSHTSSIPAAEPFANHPGMPRNPEEINRATASYRVNSCSVRTDGIRLKIIFPGVEAGIFSGYLQYDIYKGSNLIRQMLVAKTDHPSAAFKYDAGISGNQLKDSRLVWRDLQNNWQSQNIEEEEQIVQTIKSNHRLVAAEFSHGAISAFPPPHRFYWARESEQNLGYGWYRIDDSGHFSFGIRQAELEEDPEFYHNFALYNARPGLWQRMPLFLYVSPGDGKQAIEASLKFTNGDRYKPIPGYKVMGSHYHVGLVKRLKEYSGDSPSLNDVETMKSVGVNIYGVIDGVRGPGRHDRGELFLEELDNYYEAARSLSDSNFLVMPNDENSTGGRPPFMGGHYDIMISKPLYWRPARAPGAPLYQNHSKYGKVYNLGSPEDMMQMTELENVIISMPHPRAKKSTGYPEAIKDQPHFRHPNYFGLGYRWGMGIDASEIRLGEYRFLSMWNEVNNWMAQQGLPPKYALAISETRSDIGERGKPLEDDTYGMSPVNYLKIDRVPSVDDMSAVINVLKSGEFFVTTGEVLIPDFEVMGTGGDRKFVAEVQWTFPLEFVELIWGDGESTNRQLIETSDLEDFGTKRFEIPFSIQGKKWIRFAAWDVAGNGALLQPVSLP